VNYFGKLLCADSLLILMKQLPAKQGYLCCDGLLREEKEDKCIAARREFLLLTLLWWVLLGLCSVLVNFL
jgi:hypothetical protein